MMFINAIYNLERKCKAIDGSKLRNAKKNWHKFWQCEENHLFPKVSPFKLKSLKQLEEGY